MKPACVMKKSVVSAQKIGLSRKMNVPPTSSWKEMKPLNPDCLSSFAGLRMCTR